MVMTWLHGWWPRGRDDDEGGKCWSGEDLQLKSVEVDDVDNGK